MFGCENRTTVPIEVTFNAGKMNFCARSPNNTLIKKVIQPNRIEFLINIRREDNQVPLRLDIDFNHKELE